MSTRRRVMTWGVHALGWVALLAAVALVRSGAHAAWMVPAVVAFVVTLSASLAELASELDADVPTETTRAASERPDDDADGADGSRMPDPDRVMSSWRVSRHSPRTSVDRSSTWTLAATEPGAVHVRRRGLVGGLPA